jgi:hypothetical protein
MLKHYESFELFHCENFDCHNVVRIAPGNLYTCYICNLKVCAICTEIMDYQLPVDVENKYRGEDWICIHCVYYLKKYVC